MVVTAIILWMTFSHLQPRIWSTISGRDRVMMLTCSVAFREVSLWSKQDCTGSIDTSTQGNQTATIPWSIAKPCSYSLGRLWAMHYCWWKSGMATCAQPQCESSSMGLFGQSEVYKLPPSCKSVVVRMQCTGLTVVQDFELWVGIVLALWRVDGGVIF